MYQAVNMAKGVAAATDSFALSTRDHVTSQKVCLNLNALSSLEPVVTEVSVTNTFQRSKV